MRINVKVNLISMFIPITQHIYFYKKHNEQTEKKPSVLTCKLNNFQFPSTNSMYNRFEEAFYNILTVI